MDQQALAQGRVPCAQGLVQGYDLDAFLETVEGFNGAWGWKNALRTWFAFSGLLGFAPFVQVFAHLRPALEALWASRFLWPAVPTWTTFLQSGHSNVLKHVNSSPCCSWFLFGC
jgi:hypothetical protein